MSDHIHDFIVALPGGFTGCGEEGCYATRFDSRPSTEQPTPLTLEEMDSIERQYANEADSVQLRDIRRLIATAREGFSDRERLEWIVAHLLYGCFDLEITRGQNVRLSVMDEDADKDALAPDWRQRIERQMTETIRRWRNASLDALEPCPRCGEPFHVHASFEEARPADRFLWWSWPAKPARWDARCGTCGKRYTVNAQESGT